MVSTRLVDTLYPDINVNTDQILGSVNNGEGEVKHQGFFVCGPDGNRLVFYQGDKIGM